MGGREEKGVLGMMGFGHFQVSIVKEWVGAVPLAELGSRMIMGWVVDLQFKHVRMKMLC